MSPENLLPLFLLPLFYWSWYLLFIIYSWCILKRIPGSLQWCARSCLLTPPELLSAFSVPMSDFWRWCKGNSGLWFPARFDNLGPRQMHRESELWRFSPWLPPCEVASGRFPSWTVITILPEASSPGHPLQRVPGPHFIPLHQVGEWGDTSAASHPVPAPPLVAVLYLTHTLQTVPLERNPSWITLNWPSASCWDSGRYKYSYM